MFSEHFVGFFFFHKKTSPAFWVDFLPISLCNGSNKIFTKLLVLRLTFLLPRIISPFKSRFVPSRVTHGNMLLVQELVYDLNRHTWGNNVMLKLYTAKAYDRITWSYIIQMLQSFGFQNSGSHSSELYFVLWFLVLVNRPTHEFFKCQSGLWQDNLLSRVYLSLLLSFYLRAWTGCILGFLLYDLHYYACSCLLFKLCV